MQCTGIVLAKIDGTAKGGVVVPIRQQVRPAGEILGVGEKAEDLTLFNPDEFVEAMFADLSTEAKCNRRRNWWRFNRNNSREIEGGFAQACR